jgi:hypothetical protein
MTKPTHCRQLRMIKESQAGVYNAGGAVEIAADVAGYFQYKTVTRRKAHEPQGYNGPSSVSRQAQHCEVPGISCDLDYVQAHKWLTMAFELFQKTTNAGLDTYEFRKKRQGVHNIERYTLEMGEEEDATRAAGGIMQSLEVSCARKAEPQLSVALAAKQGTQHVEMTGTAAQPEIRTLVFNEAPAVQEFGIKVASGATDVSVITPAMTNNQIKAEIEGNADLAGFTVTITGALVTTNGKVSGTLTLTFSPNGNVPTLIVEASNSQTLTLTNATGPGTWGGAAVTPGNTEGTVQTALQGTGGPNANVIVKGSSTAVVPGATTSVVVSGAGSGEYNGTYNPNGTFNGATLFQIDGTHILFYHSGTNQWRIAASTAGGAFYSAPASGTTVVPSTGWTTGIGVGPAPTVAPTNGVGSGGNGSYVGYWPYSAGAVALQNATGTGFARSLTTGYGNVATTITGATTQSGRSTGVTPRQAAPASSADWTFSRAADLDDIDDAGNLITAAYDHNIKIDDITKPRFTANGTETFDRDLDGKRVISMVVSLDEDSDGPVEDLRAGANDTANRMSTPAWNQIKYACGDALHALIFQLHGAVDGDIEPQDDEDAFGAQFTFVENLFSGEDFDFRVLLKVPAGTLD